MQESRCLIELFAGINMHGIAFKCYVLATSN